ncbi:MAG: cupin domain-containing protein [Erysipelotrichaceae bacterium]|nr:cupin domain-containing protein [Erysipelotrichaceae bacterium]MCI9312024.1 cupin domain-containing protein [Erysipelotrichaceae bacterium]
MDIGRKLKQLRIRKDLTLEELASRSELTKGFLSQVERNLTSPSVSTLEDILAALGTDLAAFFKEASEEQIVFHQDDFFVDEQEDFTIHWIIPNAQKNEMEPMILTLNPQGVSHTIDPHIGEEFGYVLQGRITLVNGDKEYTLKKGETFYISGRNTHYIKNSGKHEASLLWVSTPPMF